MAADNENISVLDFGARFAGKLREPGVVRSLLTALLAKRETAMSVGLLVQNNAQQYPQRVAIKSGDEAWTWSEVNAWTNRYAAVFSAQGLKPGEVVGINMANRVECLISVFATLKLGGVAGMLNTSHSGEVLQHSLGLIGPKLLVVGEEQMESMRSAGDWAPGVANSPIFFVADGSASPAPEACIDLPAQARDAPADNPAITERLQLKAPCYYIFTSGTTGMPKASVMTHFRWYRAGLLAGKACMSMTVDDVFYCALPFYHNNALTLSLGASLHSGAALAIGRKFSASGFWDECRHYGATSFCYIGELLRYLLLQPPRSDDQSHKVHKIMGNGLRPDVWDEFKQRFAVPRIHEFYGSSEGNNGFVNMFNYDKTCGWAYEGWKLVAYDIDADAPLRDRRGRMRALRKGEVGLLITEVSDKYPFDGYTDESATEKKLFRNVFRKGDCWFNSGDLMRHQGCQHVQFVDRVGDTFRWQGENVATTQVEAVIMHWPSTADAVVYGVEVPGRDGRCGMVSYTPNEGQDPDLDGLARHMRESLPKYAVPRFLRLHGPAEVTGTFKHQKARLKKEGWDLQQTDDALYLLAPAASGFVQIDETLKLQIESGEIKL